MTRAAMTAEELCDECSRIAAIAGRGTHVWAHASNNVRPGVGVTAGVGNRSSVFFGSDWPEAFAKAEAYVREKFGGADREYESWFAPAPALAAE